MSDENQEMSKAYGVPLRDTGRTDRVSALIGPDGKVAAAYTTVTPADHPDEVIADLDRLG